ncbi:MAG: histone deacetylase family protein [Actinobacteria bacterium]|nr:histone deacetylase family protein [Actinomycetota bacterium]
MAQIPVISSPAHVGHAPAMEIIAGVSIPSIDMIERVDVIERALVRESGYRFERGREHGDEALLAVHSPAMVEFLRTAWERYGHLRPEGTDVIVADTFVHERLRAGLEPLEECREGPATIGEFTFDTIAALGPDTFAAARASVDVALTGVDELLAGERLALALCRPPGHHATRDLFGGGTYLNNVAIAAEELRRSGHERVAILDTDYHSGNGTQSIFYDRGDVFFASIHASPARAYPFHVGWEGERGAGDGRGATLNVHLPPDTGGAGYLELLAPVLSRIAAFEPDVLVVSLGFDTYVDDPFDGGLKIGDYAEIGRAIGELGLPTLAVLEGGYNLEGLGAGLAAWMEGARSMRATSVEERS